eukprot:gene6596-10759_t
MFVDEEEKLKSELLRYEPFMRFDYPPSTCEYFKTILVALVILPCRLISMLFFMFLSTIVLCCIKCTQKDLIYSELRGCSKQFYDLIILFSRCGLFCGGYLCIQRKTIEKFEQEKEAKPLLEDRNNEEIIINIESSESEIDIKEDEKTEENEEIFQLMEEIKQIRDDKNIQQKQPCIIVSNHLSMADILFSIEEFGMTSFVARGNLVNFPFFGSFLQQIECILVENGSQVQKEILKRQIEYYKNDSSQRLVIYPEGTTTNGNFILPFKKGAFFAGLPVQIMIIKQHWNHFQPTWETIPEFNFYFRLFTQFQNYVEIIHLPVYYPNENEIKDPELYAENVRKLMAKMSNLKLSSSTREDK